MSSLAKREAALAAQAEPEASPASAARTRPISIHLTPLAPGCAERRIDDAKRWHTFYGATPSQVMRATLRRIGLAPGAVKPQGEVNGDVLLMAEVPPEVLRLVSAKPGELAPFAVIWDGMTPGEVQAELDVLVANGWRPDAQVAA